MSLILVVEPDSRHAAQLASIAQNHLHAELVMADSGDRAVAALADRVPDIVLTAPLLPHRDETVLSDYLRALGAAGAHVQTLTIPILSAPAAPQHSVRGMFRRERADQGAPNGCDPALFAEQVGQYLRRARQSRGNGPLPSPPPAPPTITIEDTPPQEVLVAEVVREYEPEDVDLTPFLANLSEPVEPELEPIEPVEPIAPVEPMVRPTETQIVEGELVVAPASTSFARARSRSTFLPAVRHAPVGRSEAPRENLPQVITVPTSSNGDGQAAVNVAVAVSVQVTAPPISGGDHRWGPASAGPAKAPQRNSKSPKPVQDEWGFFDPDQCGFRALLARLDAIAATEDQDS